MGKTKRDRSSGLPVHWQVRARDIGDGRWIVAGGPYAEKSEAHARVNELADMAGYLPEDLMITGASPELLGSDDL